ncbi:hypothetical protein [Acidocella aromatica]|uniref:Uncharacterized protein n=1 Tax=Acidocella aromatica TaxID=1303579 RepID=A0A840VFG2_9PROT|nr:hypothetical protein [Acidocella aromatica]MBB5374436.1 hypothetical protein [Acidocella aromatica]
MSQSLVDKLPDISGKAGLRVWLKSSGYARRLLLGEAGDPWLGAAAYLAYFGQANGLLRPDIAVLEVDDLLRSWAKRHPALTSEMAAKRRTSYPLRKLLEAEGPRQLLAEVAEAVAGAVRGQVPVVLAMATPRAWLGMASQLTGRDDVTVEDDDLEDAAMYMADFFRSVSSAPVGGVFLEDGKAPAQLGDAARCRPVVNVARHYRWGIVWRTQGDAGEALAEMVDGLVMPLPPTGLAKAAGLEVGPALWSGAALPPLAPGQFYFAEIPVDQKPETVLDNLSRLR